MLIVVWGVMAMAWAGLHGFIVPRIDEFRPQLENQASRALGIAVQIGTIQVHSDGTLFPTFELSQVRLLDAQGREAVVLPRVLAVLSPRSLWKLGFEQLYVEQARLDVRRNAQGRVVVGGLELSQAAQLDEKAADWFFSQTEVVLRDGTLTWTDELRQLAPVTFNQVDLTLRNTRWSHAVRVDATPPHDWGERFSASGLFRQHLLTSHPGRWQEWEGQVYGLWQEVDLSRLAPYLETHPRVDQGRGALRLWMDVRDGAVTGGAADVALRDLSMTSEARPAPLVLSQLSGRLSGRWWEQGFEFATQGLQFEAEDAMRWPGGNVQLKYERTQGRTPERGEFQADRLDLASLSHVLARFDLPPSVQLLLARHAPRGLVEQIRVSWQGSVQDPMFYTARGRISQLALAAQPAAAPVSAPTKPGPGSTQPVLGIPGIQGAAVDFDFNQASGKAQVQLHDGQLEFPGLFEEPALPLTQLSAEVQWQRQGDHWSVTLPNLRFANADAQGEAQLKWQTHDANGPGPSSGLPGVLDLQGSLSRAQLVRVARYLPQHIPAEVRDYLRQSIRQGQGQAVKFRVKGDLREFPFVDARRGEFRVSANLRDATLAYVPRSLQDPQELPWPALQQMSGELLIDRNTLQVRDVSARMAGLPAARILKAEVTLADYLHLPVVQVTLADYLHLPVVQVSAEARGPVAEWLGGLVKGSPLAELAGPMLAGAQGTGTMDLDLKFKLPLADLSRLSFQGRATLPGNDLQLGPDIPRLGRARGTVHFTEAGFAVSGLTARVLGGDARAEGGTIAVPGARAGGPPGLRIQGTVTADGLRTARELPLLMALGQQASGSTPYSLALAFRRGVPEVQFSSTLQGLALQLPPPFNKAADSALPVRLDSALTREALASPTAPLQDQLTVDAGRLGSATFVRSLAQPEPRVLRGAVVLGPPSGEAPALPVEGVVAQINLPTLDLDAWGKLMTPAPAAQASSADAMRSYMPTRVALRARQLTLGGRTLNQVVMGASHEAETWRANVDAQELSGYLEYRQPTAANPGRVHARLARLSVAQATASEVEALLDEQPVSVPALDIVVDDLDLRGKKIGRVEVEAVNRGGAGVAREWRLNKFNIQNAEAMFTATGNWVLIGESGPRAPGAALPRAGSERRRTVMNFKLDVADAGELLARLGMKDVIRRGRGKLDGQLSWVGSPLALDYPTLGGSFNLNIETGQFLKAEPGVAKLLGVLSLQALPRRLALDFRDVFSEGFAFDFVRGDVLIDRGMATTNNLQMKGVNAAVLMEGRADIARETQDLKVVVVPEINAGTASLIATWINPTVGLGSFLAQLFLRRPLIESATQEFRITGSWSDPKVVRTDTATQPKRGTPP